MFGRLGRLFGLGSATHTHTTEGQRSAGIAQDHLLAVGDAFEAGDCKVALESLQKASFAMGQLGAHAEASRSSTGDMSISLVQTFNGLKEVRAAAEEGYLQRCVDPERRMEHRSVRARPAGPLLEL